MVRSLSRLLGSRQLVAVVQDAYAAWFRQRTVRLGASLAYYGLFAIVPVVALALALLTWLFSAAEVESFVAEVSADLLDADAQEQLAVAVGDTVDRSSVRSGLGVFGAASLVFAGSLLFLALADAANLVWDVPVERGLRANLRRRLLAFATVLGLSAVGIAIFVLRWFGGVLARLTPDAVTVDLALHAAEVVLGVGLLTVVLGLLTTVLAPVRVRPVSVAVGAAASALCMMIGSELFGVYVDLAFTTSLTGAAGGLLVFLLWTYVIAQILLAGMHLTRSLDEYLGEESPDPTRSGGVAQDPTEGDDDP